MKSNLTNRENEILKAVARATWEDRPLKAESDRIGIAVKTMEVHLKAIRLKLKVHKTATAVLRYLIPGGIALMLLTISCAPKHFGILEKPKSPLGQKLEARRVEHAQTNVVPASVTGFHRATAEVAMTGGLNLVGSTAIITNDPSLHAFQVLDYTIMDGTKQMIQEFDANMNLIGESEWDPKVYGNTFLVDDRRPNAARFFKVRIIPPPIQP